MLPSSALVKQRRSIDIRRRAPTSSNIVSGHCARIALDGAVLRGLSPERVSRNEGVFVLFRPSADRRMVSLGATADKDGRVRRNLAIGKTARYRPRIGVLMELRMYCAYNQTRECFLGLEVAAGDFSYRTLSKQGALTIKPNEGLWLTPFRGMPDSGITAPVDLIYLDMNCSVIDLVESFPADRSTSPNAATETVLVLPSRSIFSSETRVGDQLVLCVAEEMQHRLERLSSEGSECSAVSAVIRPMQKPLESGDEGLAALKEQSQAEGIRSESLLEKPQPNSEKGRFGSPKNWLRRWWSTELRQAPRQFAPALEAFYWNGLPPSPHDIRDISSKGLYLVTDDRWYPGTLVLMTLQEKDGPVEGTEHAISVRVRAVRCGEDGVGLQFVVANDDKLQDRLQVNETGRKELEDFLRRLEKLK